MKKNSKSQMSGLSNLMIQRSLLAACCGAVLFVVGCTSQEKVAVDDRPVPEGYESWEAYGKAQDKNARDFEHDRSRIIQDRSRVGGVMR